MPAGSSPNTQPPATTEPGYMVRLKPEFDKRHTRIIDLNVSKLSGMLPADAGESCEGRTAADNMTARNVFIVAPGKKVKLIIAGAVSADEAKTIYPQLH